MAKERKSGALPWMRPDGKSQVTVEYDENGNVSWCPTIVISTQHDPDISIKDLREAIVEQIIRPTLPKELIRPETQLLRQPHRPFRGGRPRGRFRPDRS